MIPRIVEIAESDRYLSIYRGFMRVRHQGEEIGRVPLDDIGAVIAHGHGLSYSNNLLVALAERKAAFVLCDHRHVPVGILWPVEGHHQQGMRMDAQFNATRPLQRRLWQSLVRCKIRHQAKVLDYLGRPSIPISALEGKVRSGDPDNVEAQAARRYWPLLFGEGFRRDRNLDGQNALLNYGYMVLRAATARAVIAAGLHPTLGLHHHNATNPMRLVDDLMEPFRPLVDLAVRGLTQQGKMDVDKDTKRRMAALLYQDMATNAGTTPLVNVLVRLSQSLVDVYLKERKGLEFPLLPTPLELEAIAHPEL